MEKLNNLQNKIVKQTIKQLKQSKKALIQMATGTGKTEVGIKLIKKLKPKKTLWLTHTNELVDQSLNRIQNKLKTKTTMFAKGNLDKSGSVVVASIPSISKINNLNKFRKNKEFDLIIVDEAHHIVAKTWLKTLNRFNKAYKVGLTATPYRPDGLDITEHFGEVNYKLDFNSAQKQRFIAPHRAYVILTNSIINGFTNKFEEFTSKQLEKLYTSVDRNNIIVKSYLQEGRKQIIKNKMKPKAICFCINIEHAKRMKSLFNKNGVQSDIIVGDTKHQSNDHRAKVFNRFKNTDEIEVLCTVNAFNEGIDIPNANIAIMARPTRSNIIYQQQVGRVARRNKKFFVVLDFVDNSTKEYLGYVMGNLAQENKISHKRIITHYLLEKDEVIISKRVKNLMASINKFEQNIINRIKSIKEENIKFMIKYNKVDPRIYE